MNKKYHDRIRFFLEKPSMFIGKENKELVVAFITAFEYAADDGLGLIDQLKQYLEQEQGIFGGPMGWPNAVELYSKKMNLNWFDAFKEITEQLMKVDNERKQE